MKHALYTSIQRLRLCLTLTLAMAMFVPLNANAERTYTDRENSGRPPLTKLSLLDGELDLVFSGRVQLQAAILAGEQSQLARGDLAEEAGFLMRRVRLGTEVTYNGLGVGIELDLVNLDSMINEAYVGYENDWFFAYGGLVKVPYTRGALVSSEALQHVDRARLVTAMAPFQQLGLHMAGTFWDKKARLHLGVYNGMERSALFESGWNQISPRIGNRFEGYAIAGRFELEPLGLMGEGIADLGQETHARLGLGGGVIYNDGGTSTTFGYSADLMFKMYGVGFIAEYIEQTASPKEAPTQATTLPLETTRRGVNTQLGYTVMKRFLEIAARFEWVDNNTEIEDDGDYFVIGGTASLYILDGYLWTQVAYQHRMERFGNALDNDVFVVQVEGRF